jgi:hypothetical protein
MTHASDIPCRVEIRQSMPVERAVGGRLSAVTEINVLLSTVSTRWPNGIVSVEGTDQLVVTGEGAGTYEPVGPGGPATDDWVWFVPSQQIA